MAVALPLATRTQFLHVAGDPDTYLEDAWSVESDSPMISSLEFVPWIDDTPPSTRKKAPRSSLAGVLLLAALPPEEAHLASFDGMSILDEELNADVASDMARQLDAAGAFDTTYTRPVDFVLALPGLVALVLHPDVLKLERLVSTPARATAAATATEWRLLNDLAERYRVRLHG